MFALGLRVTVRKYEIYRLPSIVRTKYELLSDMHVVWLKET